MTPQRILFLVTEDWYFIAHRLPMARAARDAGFEVHVATHVAAHGAQILAERFVLHPMTWNRGSANPVAALLVARHVRALYRQLRPDLVHCVAVQPSVIGSLASLGLPVITINALAGLGFAFTSTTPRARAVRAALQPLMRHVVGRAGSTILVENPDDRAALIALGVDASVVEVIPGSGVDVDRLLPLPEPEGPITFAYAGRLLKDKGLASLIAAHDLLRARGRPVRLLIAGAIDAANPASFSEAETAAWRNRPGVEVLGHVGDIREVWARAHVAVLPSRREGLPVSLLEAAACGRPMIATDAPGCREVARADNAILVGVDDPPALADAMERFAADADLRRRCGVAGRRLVESVYSSRRVGEAIVAIYARRLHRGAAAPKAS